MSRSFPALLTILASVGVAGCGDDDEKPKEYVLANHYAVTGFYISPMEGGHLYIEVDEWGEKASPALVGPLRPSSHLPVGIRVTLRPDDGGAPIEMVGYGNTTSASGGGYGFSVGSLGDGRLSGYIYSPHGNGYCRGLVGSADSIEVYLGTFAGDSLHGRWNLVAPDTAMYTTFPNQVNFLGLAFDSGNAAGYLSLDGYYVPSTTGPGYGMQIYGFGPGSTNWFGQGTLTADKSSASGTSAVGSWSVTRYTPPSP